MYVQFRNGRSNDLYTWHVYDMGEPEIYFSNSVESWKNTIGNRSGERGIRDNNNKSTGGMGEREKE